MSNTITPTMSYAEALAFVTKYGKRIGALCMRQDSEALDVFATYGVVQARPFDEIARGLFVTAVHNFCTQKLAELESVKVPS